MLTVAGLETTYGESQVLWDVFHTDRSRRILSWALFLFWLSISLVGAIAIIGGVRQ